MHYSLSGSSVHGILPTRILEWAAMPSSRGSFQHRNQTQVSHNAGRFFTIWATYPMNIQGWFPLGLTGLISLQSKGLFKSLLQHHSSKASILWHSAFYIVQLSHPYMTTGKTIALTRQTYVGKVMSLLLNMLSRLVITFLPRSKHLLISWLQSPCAVIFGSGPEKCWTGWSTSWNQDFQEKYK